MRVVLVVGGGAGLGAALAAALRGSGVAVALGDVGMPISPPEPFPVPTLAELDKMMRQLEPRPVPFPAALVERLRPQSRPVPRWLPRPREHRTRRK